MYVELSVLFAAVLCFDMQCVVLVCVVFGEDLYCALRTCQVLYCVYVGYI